MPALDDESFSGYPKKFGVGIRARICPSSSTVTCVRESIDSTNIDGRASR
jgi:hypothetical protein